MSGAPVHAALIVGPAGVGKRTLAALLAQSLHCSAPHRKPCGICPSCVRFASGSHPDAHRIQQQKRILIDEVRALIAALSIVAYEGGVKTIQIENAEAMTPQAQNALLKTLEEPPGDTVFLLTAVSLAQILPTIRSRCRIVQLPPMAEEAVREALERRGISRDIAARAAALSGGSVGEALKMAEDGAFWQLQARVMQAMDSVRSPVDVWKAVEALKDDRPAAADVCGLLETSLRSMLRLRTAGKGMPANAWEETLAGMGPRFLIKRLEAVQTLRRMLASNVSWHAALERFILEYVEDVWQS